MVLAGPGSGKTMVITNRIKALIDSGVRPESILVITFTRAAAAQMRTRFLSLVSPKTYHVTFGTFHAIFFQILKHAYNYGADSILRPEENFSILVSIAEQLHITPDDMREWAAAVTAEISRVKSEQTSSRILLFDVLPGGGIPEGLPSLRRAPEAGRKDRLRRHVRLHTRPVPRAPGQSSPPGSSVFRIS